MILLVDKPSGMTSHDVVSKIKRASPEKIKIGHTGTLDPICTGVLPVLTGNSTKLSDLFIGNKAYTAFLKLGIVTDTEDITGNILAENEVLVNYNEVFSAIKSFVGKISQVPPMYSAIKINGVKLYDLARKGIEIERKSREIEVFSIENVSILSENEYSFDVYCSSGTYIRTLCHEIGKKLRTGGAMSGLRRIESNGFSISECHSLDKVVEMAKTSRLAEIDVDVQKAFSYLNKLTIPSEAEHFYLNGGKVAINRILDFNGYEKNINFKYYKVFNINGKFLGLCEIIDGEIKGVWKVDN